MSVPVRKNVRIVLLVDERNVFLVEMSCMRPSDLSSARWPHAVQHERNSIGGCHARRVSCQSG